MFKVVNATEKLVWNELAKMLRFTKLKCDCDKCKSDIVALTLSKLKPHYVTIREDETLLLTGIQNHQIQVDVLSKLSESVVIIGENPRHVSEDEKIQIFDITTVW